MQMHRFSVVVEPQESGFRAWCPVLREHGAVAQAETQEEAILILHDVVAAILEDRRKAGKSMPEPSGEMFDGVRSFITVIEELDDWSPQDLTHLGLPISDGVKPPKPKPKKR